MGYERASLHPIQGHPSPGIIAAQPPSTNNAVPATKSESSEARNSMARARSIGSPGRLRRFTTLRSGLNSSLPTGEPILFGTTQFTRILYGASWIASDRVRFTTPALAEV